MPKRVLQKSRSRYHEIRITTSETRCGSIFDATCVVLLFLTATNEP